MKLVRRLLEAVATLIAASLVAFIVCFVVFDFDRAGNAAPDVQRVQRALQEYGLDQPSYELYPKLMWRLISEASLGRSLATGNEVAPSALRATAVTGSLVLAAVVLWMAVAVAVGTVWAKRGTSRRRPFSYLALALHPIWLGLTLGFFVGFRAELFPVAGYCDFFDPPQQSGCAGRASWLSHLVLPAVTLGLAFAGIYARAIRAVLVSARERARDRRDREVETRRVQRFAETAAPVALMLRRDVGVAFGTAAFVEVVFGLPGLGFVMVRAAGLIDAPMMWGVLMTASAVAIGLQLVFDAVAAGARRGLMPQP